MVANDSTANFLFINDGTGNFSEEALLSGFALDRRGNSNGNMGIECGDVDRDGRIDLLTTTYQAEMPVLYFNQGGFFADVTNLSRLDTTLLAHVNWGTGIADFDNDRDVDLFIACGHFMDNIQYIDDTTTLKVRNYLLVNDGRGKFGSAAEVDGLEAVESSRGAAFGDLDNDGDLDVVVLNSNARPTILRNDQSSSRGLLVNLCDSALNRGAIGARVQLQQEGRPQVAEVHAGRGYQSHYGTRLHFGLGESEAEATITVRWPDGDEEVFPVPNAATEILLRRGQSALLY